MRIKELVERMGSVRRFCDKPFQEVSKDMLAKYLDINNPVFKDYIDYLANYGGETSLKDNYEIRSVNKRAEYYESDKPWCINLYFGGVDLGCMFGEGEHFNEGYTINYTLNFLKGRIPEGYIPISVDSFGGYMLLSVANENIGKIYFWDGHNDADKEEFYEDYGIEMPEEVKMQNMFCIGENLYDCFLRMEKAEDE